MDVRMNKKWDDNKNLTVKVTNKVCGRVDIHKNISREDLSWIQCNSNLDIEVLEYNMEKKRKPKLKEE